VETITFTVDAALLRELGERLVGRPHIALAELIKNGYDADATKVEVRVTPSTIEVVDNGHGMTEEAFKRFWMRIGTPHKQEDRTSPTLGRPLTGSKGVGRLAVQFLGRNVSITTVSTKSTSQLEATVDWDKAIKKHELTQAEAQYTTSKAHVRFPGDSQHGTRVTISRLTHRFTSDDLQKLGQEIWMLLPPFRTNPDLESDAAKSFDVQLETEPQQDAAAFKAQMAAWLNNWHATIVGKLDVAPKKLGIDSGMVDLAVTFQGGETFTHRLEVEHCMLHEVEFEVRVFHLMYRQKHGIEVGKLREYLREHGGVHVYDAEFHLPYYGLESDWLALQLDHSRRISLSQLLPKKLQVAEGMTFLPTNARVFGVVRVNTATERDYALTSNKSVAARCLTVQVSRDRLVDNDAFDQLKTIVRFAIDMYAAKEALRQQDMGRASSAVEPMTRKVARVADVLERYETSIPKPVYAELKAGIKEAVRAAEHEVEQLTAKSGLLGALALTGISAVAFEHEINKRYGELEGLREELDALADGPTVDRSVLRRVAKRLRKWIEDARATRSLFLSLTEEENRTKTDRFKARPLIEQVQQHIEPLMRDSELDYDGIDADIRLPTATFAEWSAVFQNVLVNAVNAMLDSRVRKISVSSRSRGDERMILVQDTGAGVDLDTADELFQPFVRKLKISKERQSLGLGGTGLGLAIVRMIADGRNCRVGFVKPDHGFKSAFRLAWSER
jgi:signal transduction histidine kinase